MEEQTFSIDLGFQIGMIFLCDLWEEVIQPRLLTTSPSEHLLTKHEIFFQIECSGEEQGTKAHWKNAVALFKKVSKQEVDRLQLSREDVFSSTLLFCKLFNDSDEYHQGDLNFSIRILEAMKMTPSEHSQEWKIWEKALVQVLNGIRLGGWYST